MTWSGNKNREVGRHHCRRAHYNSSSDSSRGSPSPKQFEDRKSPSELKSKASLTLRNSPTSSESFSVIGLSRSPSPQGCAYAGAKFNDPPLPQFLPKPPSQWICNLSLVESNNLDAASLLKMMLKVPDL